MNALLIALLDASQHIALLMLVTMGLAIVFGLMRVINLAHGEFMMVGAYIALLVHRAQWPFVVGLIVAPLALAALGLVVEALVVRRVYERPLETLLATWGLALMLKQSIVLLFGPGAQALPNPVPGSVMLGGMPYPLYRLLLIGLSLTILSLILWVVYRTTLGLQIRSVMQDRAMAACLGIPTRRLDQLSFACGAGLAGLAGAVLAPLSAIDPYLGVSWLVPAFLAVLVGGLGSLMTPMLGAAALGGTESLVGAFWSSIGAELSVFVFAIACLRLFPEGFTRRRGERQL